MNENNETRSKVKQLRELIISSEIHHRGREDDAFLLRFLRAKKFDVEKAFKMIQKYYCMKEHSPELFHVSPPSDLKNMLEMQIQCMLNTKDQHGRQVYLFRVGMYEKINSLHLNNSLIYNQKQKNVIPTRFESNICFGQTCLH